MDVQEAILSRRSIRAFTDQPVPLETIQKIMEVSQRSPSGTNTQPWHAYVCTGEVKEAITRDVLELVDQGGAKKYSDYDYYPDDWKPVHRDRRRRRAVPSSLLAAYLLVLLLLLLRALLLLPLLPLPSLAPPPPSHRGAWRGRLHI